MLQTAFTVTPIIVHLHTESLIIGKTAWSRSAIAGIRNQYNWFGIVCPVNI